jgi:hypothetical protein
MLLGLFLTVEDNALDASDFYDRTKVACAKDSALRVPIKSSGEGRDCRTSNQEVPVSFDSHCFTIMNLLKILSDVNGPHMAYSSGKVVAK